MTNKKTKVVVTGGAGFIGSHVTKKLIEEGFEVFIIDNLYAGKKENIHPEAKFYNLDVRNLKDIEPIFKDAKYVFHFAAIPSVQYSIENPQETNDVNIGGTLNVLTAAKNAGVKRVIYSASSSVYGDAKILPITENESAKPKSPYALQKYVGELYCKMFSEIYPHTYPNKWINNNNVDNKNFNKESNKNMSGGIGVISEDFGAGVYGLETVCLRYFNVYGDGQPSTGAYASVIAKFLALKKENKPLTIIGDGNNTRDFVNVDDVAEANILAATSTRVGKGESINIGTGKKYSVKEIAKIIGGQTVSLPARIEPKDSLADISLAKFLLDWEPKITLEKGLKELLPGSEF